MEELVNKLADLQAELTQIEDEEAKNLDIMECNASIERLEKQITELHKSTSFLRAGYAEATETVKSEIDDVNNRILNEWDGQEKTVHFDAGTLKFRTTKSLQIVDGGRLLEHMITNTSTEEAVNKYLKGFLLTPTKAYIGVHGLGEGIAKINSKTTVKLEQKSG